MKKYILLGVYMTACATPKKIICKSEAEEAVSNCRAEEACKYYTGARTGFKSSLGSYNSCFNQEMQKQKEAAKAKEKGG